MSFFKQMKSKAFTAVISLVVISMMGCYGSFSLTKKLHDFNGNIAGTEINSILMIIGSGAYGLTIAADAIIFNTLEYWTGSNPVAMEEDATEEKIISLDGELYRLKASKNTLSAERLTGENREVALIFQEEDQSWIMQTPEKTTRIARVKGDQLEVIH